MTDISFLSTVPAEQISFVEEGNLIVKAIKKGPLQNTFSSSHRSMPCICIPKIPKYSPLRAQCSLGYIYS